MSDPIRVGVCGAKGRMGAEVSTAITESPDTELVGAIDVDGSVTELVGAQVVVDFTVADAARSNLPEIAAAGIHAVVGTSGLTESDHQDLTAAFAQSHCLIAPNFAIGAVLMMRFAELASPYFPTAEVIEMHHNAKVDSPSGTALATLEKMAEVSKTWDADPTQAHSIAGARGGKGPSDIPVHSVRLKGAVAHQEVRFGGDGETLTIRHDSLNRASFMPGVLAAVRRIVDMPAGLTVGLGEFLDI